MFEATARGLHEVVRSLVALGANLDTVTTHMKLTPLLLAVEMEDRCVLCPRFASSPSLARSFFPRKSSVLCVCGFSPLLLVCDGVLVLLVCAGVCWCVLVCAGVCWCVLVSAGECWCVLVCAGVCWCVLVCAGVCW